MSMRLRSSTRYGINTALVIVIFLGIISLIGTLSYRHNWRKDFTANKRHSLSEQTRNVLKELSAPIRVTAFVWKGSSAYDEVKELLDLYKYESDMFNVALVDPDLDPRLANEYEIGKYQVPVVFFEEEKGRETISDLTEEQATNALIKITRGKKKIVCFTTGHGERLLDSTDDSGLSIAQKLLENKNYDSRPLLLMREEKVPSDCDILVVCGPQENLTGPELQAMEDFLRKGGRVLVLIDPEESPTLKPFLKKYGIVLGEDIVIDRLSRLFGGDYLMPIPTSYSTHPITKNFNVTPFFPLARSISTTETPEASTTWLIQTGEGSWAETDMEALKEGKATFDPERDTEGPVSLAAISEMRSAESNETEPKESSNGAIVVFGDSDFVVNSRINLSGNSEMFMNTTNWLAREENLIAIPPKEKSFSPVVLTASEARALFVLPVIMLPGMVLVVAVYVFVRRSRHP